MAQDVGSLGRPSAIDGEAPGRVEGRASAGGRPDVVGRPIGSCTGEEKSSKNSRSVALLLAD